MARHLTRVRLQFLFLSSLVWLAWANCAQAQTVNLEALLAENPARQLSEYGLFLNPAQQLPAEEVIPYTLRTPLFSDHAIKYRFIYVPPGTKAGYADREVFEFPVGSALIKTFAFPADLRKPEEAVRLIETRLLVRKEDGWHGWAYLWDEDGSEAVLKKAGKRLPISFVDHNGEPTDISYKVPNINECKNCHSLNKEMVPIGPKARNLNFPLTGKTVTQLQAMIERGLIEEPAPNSLPAAVADWKDEAAPLEARVRAWLDINCAHCHRNGGSASNSGLFLTYHEDDPTAYGIRKRPVAAGRGSGGLEFAIDPGAPERSIMIYRMKSRDPGVMMPELGRTLIDDQAIQLISKWISTLD